jgi:hypothetical protein
MKVSMYRRHARLKADRRSIRSGDAAELRRRGWFTPVNLSSTIEVGSEPGKDSLNRLCTQFEDGVGLWESIQV